MPNDYDKLKEQGYTEEEIAVMLDGLYKLRISSGPMGKNRDDRSIHIIDPSNNSKRTSSIMVGYNKEGIKLDNGEYVNLYELEDALKKALFINGENKVVVCKPTGKVIDTKEFVESIIDIVSEKEIIALSGVSSKVKNTEAAEYSIKGEDDDRYYDKGIFMLGKNSGQLTYGEYVSVDELEQALKDYVFMNPGEKEKEDAKDSFKEEPFVKSDTVQKPEKALPQKEKRKFKFGIKLPKNATIIALTTAILVSSFAAKITGEPAISRPNNDQDHKETVQDVSNDEDKISNDVFLQYDKYITGKEYSMPENIPYYSNSTPDEKGKVTMTGEFGSAERPAGDYTLEYISIVNKERNKILKVETKEGVPLSNVVRDVCNVLGISPEEFDQEFEVMFHMGGKPGQTGWVDLNDIEEANRQLENPSARTSRM